MYCKNIFTTAFVILALCLPGPGSAISAAAAEKIQLEGMELKDMADTVATGGHFIIMMNSRGEKRVINYRKPARDLTLVSSQTTETEGPVEGTAELATATTLQIIKTGTSDRQQGTVGEQLANPLEVTVLDEDNQPVSGMGITFAVKAGGGNFTDGSTTRTVQTDSNGLASVNLVLGTSTAANQVGWLEPGLNTQQVGLNVIDCYPATDPVIKTVFNAYGFPGPPAEIKVHKEIFDASLYVWGVIQFAGEVFVSVLDQYQNPVSNVPITVSAGAVTPLSGGCPYPNTDTRPALIVPMADLADQPPPFAYEQYDHYAGQPLTLTSDYIPVIFATYAGGIPKARYYVDIEASGLSAQHYVTTISRASWLGNCYGTEPPESVVWLMAYGSGAHRPGEVIDLYFWLYEMKETDKVVSQCGGCEDIVGGTEYFTGTTLSDIAFTVNGTQLSETTTPYGHVYSAWLSVSGTPGALNLDATYTKITRNRQYQSDTSCYCTVDVNVPETLDYSVGISPLDIELAPSMQISVDGNGQNRCDVEVPFLIDPPDFVPEIISLNIYEDGSPYAVIPIDPATLTPPVISRGMQFDPAKTYTAAITVNGYDAGRYDGTSSNVMELVLSDAEPIEYLYVENEKEKIPVMQGGSVTIKAKTLDQVSAGTLEWSIADFRPDVEAQTISALIDENTGVLTVAPDSANGWVTVRAAYSECLVAEVDIRIGCGECASGACPIEGGSSQQLSSIDFRASLGKTNGGNFAGYLILRSKRISQKLYTPQALRVSSLVKDNEVIRDQEGALKQVLTGKTLIDIDSLTIPYGYAINYYRPDVIIGQVDGVYAISSGAVPFASYLIENPDQSLSINDRLKITEIRGGKSIVSEYFHDPATGEWRLSLGNGQKVITRSEQVAGDVTTRLETVRNGAGVLSSQVELQYREFSWGEELIEKAVDPNGANLVTLITYYEDPQAEGSYGKVQSVVNPDGSWTYYQYDTLGRITAGYSSWLDTDIGQKEGARVTRYSYDSAALGTDDSNLEEDRNKPRVIIEEINESEVARKYFAYRASGSDEKSTIDEICTIPGAPYGSSNNLRTVTTSYSENMIGPDSGRVKTIIHPDGRLTTYGYEQGTYDIAQHTFTPGTGGDEKTTVTHGTETFPSGIAGKTTRDISISDNFGNQIYEETLVHSGAGYSTVQWVEKEFDDFGRVLRSISSDGTIVETTWSCCGKESETDATGVTSLFEYDDLKRLETKSTATEQGDIITLYTYDASSRKLSETVSAGALSLVSSSAYDPAGRITSQTDNRHLTTAYAYENGGRKTIKTLPGDITEITETYLDGRVKSVTGTGVIATYYTYGAGGDGTTYTTIHTGSPASPAWETTVADMAGRTVRREKSGYSGNEISTNAYNNLGQLTVSTSPGMAATLYAYDELGSRTRSGLDINGNDMLDEASDDRIQGTESGFLYADGAWWQENVLYLFPDQGAGTKKVISSTRKRLTGLGTAGLLSETVSTDIHGNNTHDTIFLDRTLHKTTRRVDSPASATDSVSTTVYGLIKSSTDMAGITMTYEYDALGRNIASIDPRNGLSTIHYNDRGEVDYTEDAASNRTSYGYDPATGRKISVTDALAKTIYYRYDSLGNVTHTWGATTPVRYEYDVYGRMSAMHTYRTGEGWDSPAWPEGNNVLADITRWHYHEASGLLEGKEDAQGRQTRYTYIEGDRLRTRTWARLSGGGNLVTTYSYDPLTGELITIDYADATPDIAFTYNRTGRKKDITDAVGTRAFLYTDNLQLRSETIAGVVARTIIREYSTAGFLGRDTGFSTNSNYGVTYGYDSQTGRFNSVSWNAGTASDNVLYEYEPQSHLLHSVDFDSGALTTYGYELNRNLKTEVKNEYGASLISRYAYLYDSTARRTSMTASGSAIDETATIPPAPEDVLLASVTSGNTTYATNNLNQYTGIATEGHLSEPLYDEDGNLIANDAFTYSWNGENRLISVSPANPEADDRKLDFLYDYMGRRASKIVSAWTGTQWQVVDTSLFVYDGWNMIEELDGMGATRASYIWGLDASQSLQGAGGVGGLLARVDGSGSYSYAFDGNGNVGQLLDSTGQIVAHYEYDPYGNILKKAGILAGNNPYKFSSKYFDAEADLYYYGYRYYMSEFGRWLNRDPIGEQGGVNLYGFVANEPVGRIDRLGHLLIAIDGTAMRRYLSTALLTRSNRWRSHVRNFANDYNDGPAGYWFGPDNVDGTDSRRRFTSAYSWLCKKWCEDTSQPIDMVGFSRGGYIVMELARKLKDEGICCKGKTTKTVKVRFLGMYDPVDMVLGWGYKETVPDNVENAYAVFAAFPMKNRSRWNFNRADGGPEDKSKTYYYDYYIRATHGAIGGAQAGDMPPGNSPANDNRQTVLIDQEMRDAAQSAGVNINDVADYGY